MTLGELLNEIQTKSQGHETATAIKQTQIQINQNSHSMDNGYIDKANINAKHQKQVKFCSRIV